MGSSHSSSHKRLRSISSAKNYGEFTEVVDLEFSDAGTFNEPLTVAPQVDNSPQYNIAKNMSQIPSETTPDKPKKEQSQIKYPTDLMLLEAHVNELEERVSSLTPEDFFVYFPTLKDDLHNCWQKVYSVGEPNVETKLKKYKIIDQIREVLRRLNGRLQSRK